MATAAAVLTSGMSMAQGTTPQANSEHRAYFEGDILVYTPGFLGAGPLAESSDVIVKRRLMDSGFNPLLQLYPDLLTSGYYAQGDWEYRAFSDTELEGLRLDPAIAQVTAYRSFPGSILTKKVDLKVLPDNPYMEDVDVFQGQTPNLHWDVEVALNAYETSTAAAGSIIEIEIPFFRLNEMGVPYVDSSIAPKTYMALVRRVVQTPTRVISWTQEPAPVPLSEQGYVHFSDVYLSEDTWLHIWDEQSGGQTYPTLALGLHVKSMDEVYGTVDRLRETYPSLAIFSLREVVGQVNRFNRMDRFYAAPTQYWASEQVSVHAFASQDYKTVTASLLYLNAGILLACQMLMAIASRKNEIGVLKAIGARQREVTIMILTEAGILAVLGSLVGFALVKAAGIHQALSNNVSLGNILKTAGLEQGVVLMATITAAVIFGALPAWRVSRLTVMEVFRKD